MKSFLYTLFICSILISCGSNEKKSAFEGEVMNEHPTAPVGTIPDQSIYMLTDSFQTQNNEKIILKQFAGKPTVIGMIFTHCDYACPRLTADIKNINKVLNAEEGKVNYVLISFDTERDTPDVLKKYADNLRLGNDYTLLHGSEEAVRTLSILLNVQFQKDAEGNFSHSNIISVLDKEGLLVSQKEGLEANHDLSIASLKGMLK
ncbi:MAG: SCO family protein [Ginsengibacter sp.]